MYESVVFLAGAAKSYTPMLGDVSLQRGKDNNGRHIIDTHTMRWEIYYVYLQFGRMLLSDGYPELCSGENLRTNPNKHRSEQY